MANRARGPSMHVVLCCLYHTPHVRHAGRATAGTARVDERRSALTADPAHATRSLSLLPLCGRPPSSKAAEPPAPLAAASIRTHSSGETERHRKLEHALMHTGGRRTHRGPEHDTGGCEPGHTRTCLNFTRLDLTCLTCDLSSHPHGVEGSKCVRHEAPVTWATSTSAMNPSRTNQTRQRRRW